MIKLVAFDFYIFETVENWSEGGAIYAKFFYAGVHISDFRIG